MSPACFFSRNRPATERTAAAVSTGGANAGKIRGEAHRGGAGASPGFGRGGSPGSLWQPLGAFFGSLREAVIVPGDPKHHFFGLWVVHIVCKRACLTGANAPMVRIIGERRWHSAR